MRERKNKRLRRGNEKEERNYVREKEEREKRKRDKRK